MSSLTVTQMQSGLRVASEMLPGVESVAVAVSVDVGSRHEAATENGISHLLEHMAFKGTNTRSARDIAEQFDFIGGQFNAYTSAEHTVYHAKVLKEHVGVAVEILSDILQNSVFDEAELNRERGVILQEIAMHNDTPDERVFDLLDEATFPDQPLGRSILGTPERIQNYTRDEVMGYMHKHYTPLRMVLSAAGNIEHGAFQALAEKHFAFAPDMARQHAVEPGLFKGSDVREEEDLEQLHLLLSFPALSVHDEDYHAATLYSAILGGGMSSRLFQEVREKRGLAYHVSSMVSFYADCGLLSLYSATGAEHAETLPFILADELRAMADNVSASELLRVKNQQRAELLMLRESPGRVAGWLGKHLLTFGRVRGLDEILGRIDAVNLDDIKRFATRIAETKQPGLAALGPIGTLPTLDAITARLHG